MILDFLKTITWPKWSKWAFLVVGIFFVLFGLIIASLAIYEKNFENKVYAGVKINNYSLAGLNVEQAEKIILGQTNAIFSEGFNFVYKNEKRNLPINDNGQELLKINNFTMAQEAFRLGREGNWWQKQFKVLSLLLGGHDLALNYQFDELKTTALLQQKFSPFENPPQNSQIKITVINAIATPKIYKLEFTDEKAGTILGYADAITLLKNNIGNYENTEISLILKDKDPDITKDLAKTFILEIENLLALDNLQFTYQEEIFPIKWLDFTHWLELNFHDGKTQLSLASAMVKGQLESFGQTLYQEAKNAKFKIEDGKVSEFQASQNGLEIDQDLSYEKVLSEILTDKKTSVEVIVRETEPEITIESINNLGITELVGVGESNFSGSPTNRRHNIGVGAAALNGLLISPGEEFSLVKTLGDIDGQNGYLPELVIKGNKTIPEYGGGLCQIATTVFRLALDAGLPVTERKEHSYRVSYYEPAGTDATIYQPNPDLKFVNDTNNYLLIQTSIEGNTLNFEFWGKSDGREVEQTKPKIFNITSPGPTKIVESEDLAPGQKKCTERAHAGADAIFTRTITYADGTQKVEDWRSHYVPWQAVCLVGVDKTATPTATPSP